MQRGLCQQYVLQGQVAIRAGRGRCNDHAESPAGCKQTHTSFHGQGIEVASRQGGVVRKFVLFAYILVFYIGRVTEDYVEPALLHNLIELDEPVEWKLVLVPAGEMRRMYRVRRMIRTTGMIEVSRMIGMTRVGRRSMASR